MASPWITPTTPQHSQTERPWMGMVMLAAVPLLSLLLIRMLWSGSSLWFLTVGIILLGSAAVVFLARRQQDEYGRVVAQESSRIPMVLAALGVLFLAMLLLPNFADGKSDGGDLSGLAAQQQQQQQSSGLTSDVSGVQQQQQQPTVVQQQQQQSVVQTQPTAAVQQEHQEPATSEEVSSSVGGQTYVVVDGDTLWDIADLFGTDVEAIVAANDLADEADIQIGQELIIPEGGASDATLENDTVE